MDSDEKNDNNKCPICFEIPAKEIFQCKDGHIVCGTCYPKFNQCPQCRTGFGGIKIRNRRLEEILDSMKFECHHKDMGCKKDFKRNEISTHVKTCNYNPLNQVPIQFCKLVGFDCNHSAGNTSNLDKSLLPHFSKHGIAIQPGAHVLIHVEDFASVLKNKAQEVIWTPVVLDLMGTLHGPLFLICFKTNCEDQSVSWVFLLLNDCNHDAAKFQAKLQINSLSNTVSELVWTIPSVGVQQSKLFLSTPPFRIPFAFLKDNYVRDGGLQVNVTVMKDSAEIADAATSRKGEPVWIFGLTKQPTIGMNGAASSGASTIKPSTSKAPVQHPRQMSQVFEGFVCDQCAASPLIGFRYHCLQCQNYDLCCVCMNAGVHSEHMFAIIKTEEHHNLLNQYGATKNNWGGWNWRIIFNAPMPYPSRRISYDSLGYCSWCNNVIKDVLYKCIQCQDPKGYVCKPCGDLGRHSIHILITIRNSQQHEYIRFLGRAGKFPIRFSPNNGAR